MNTWKKSVIASAYVVVLVFQIHSISLLLWGAFIAFHIVSFMFMVNEIWRKIAGEICTVTFFLTLSGFLQSPALKSVLPENIYEVLGAFSVLTLMAALFSALVLFDDKHYA